MSKELIEQLREMGGRLRREAADLLEKQAAEIEELKATPPDKREDYPSEEHAERAARIFARDTQQLKVVPKTQKEGE
jgi:hypothetical protein